MVFYGRFVWLICVIFLLQAVVDLNIYVIQCIYITYFFMSILPYMVKIV